MRTPEARRRWRRENRGRICSRCWSGPPLAGLSRCAWCRAKDAERKPWVRRLAHDTGEHALAIEAAHSGGGVCALSGLDAGALHEYGIRLEVDRIDSRRGYVRGNLQVIASRLNRAKQAFGDRLPESVVRDLVSLVSGALSLEAQIFSSSLRPRGGIW